MAFFVFSLVLAGIICLIKGINKKIKFKEINSDVVDGEIIAFVEQITLGGQNVYKETVLTYNEELLGSGTKFGTKKLYIPVFRYIYNDVEHTYRATAQFSISKVRKQNLHIGKRVELLVNRNDGSVYAPMEKRIGVLIALGILLIALGILLFALGIEILYW